MHFVRGSPINTLAVSPERLKNVAGFQYFPEPIPMKNTKGAAVYYLAHVVRFRALRPLPGLPSRLRVVLGEKISSS